MTIFYLLWITIYITSGYGVNKVGTFSVSPSAIDKSNGALFKIENIEGEFSKDRRGGATAGSYCLICS